MESIEVLADCNDLCGESPLWDARDQILYWTDIVGQRFHRHIWREKRHDVLREGFEVAGAALLDSGGFIVVNSAGIWRWDGKGDPRCIAMEAEGKRCVLNDCAADPEGRLFTGSCFFDPNNPEYERGCLFRMDTDGSVHVVDEGIQLSNGIAFSPELHAMYYADSAARVIYSYDYSSEDGRIRNRRELVRVPAEQGIPDGITVDADGFLWCAHWFGGGLFRYDPDGKLERHIPFPATQTSSVMFAGPDLTDIVVTSAASPDALSLAPPHYDPATVYSGGKLFHVNLGICGKEEYRARLRVTA